MLLALTFAAMTVGVGFALWAESASTTDEGNRVAERRYTLGVLLLVLSGALGIANGIALTT